MHRASESHSPEIRATTCLLGLKGDEDTERHLQFKGIGAGDGMWGKRKRMNFGVRKTSFFTSWLCDFGQIS